MPEGERLSDQLERWLRGPEPKTIGSLTDLFGEKSFAVLFVLLLAVPALPLPTGGVTHVFEVIAMLLALELIAGRRHVWLPRRWRRKEIGEQTRETFTKSFLPRIRWIERHSHARLGFLLSYRFAGILYGLVMLALSLAAFFAPPFTGLDTIPSLGAVLVSLGVLLEDPLLGLLGFVIGVAGILIVVFLAKQVVDLVAGLF
jgi:hypothetical protein